MNPECRLILDLPAPSVVSADLNDYEQEQNAKKPCVARDKFQIKKRHHSLTPADLQTGFGLHTFSSLQLAIRKARTPKHICLCDPCLDGQEEEAYDEQAIPIDQPSFMSLYAEERLRYLMGLPTGAEEATQRTPEVCIESFEAAEEDNLITGTSDAMRRAQRYLREHKIFEFFQFLVAHLLADIPFDPIAYLINLLDKCLIYRAGIADPPLLYDKKHIECLFNLMDRMRTGFIDYDQYKTGMYTLGIKSYNAHPPMTDDRQVTKVYFIEEGYECLKDLLNDMIRKRSQEVKKSKKIPRAPPPSVVKSICPSLANADLFV